MNIEDIKEKIECPAIERSVAEAIAARLVEMTAPSWGPDGTILPRMAGRIVCATPYPRNLLEKPVVCVGAWAASGVHRALADRVHFSPAGELIGRCQDEHHRVVKV